MSNPERSTAAAEPAVYAEPAVSPEDAGAFAQPAPEAPPPSHPQLSIVRADRRNYRRVVAAILKALDRGLSLALRVPTTGAEELEQFVEAMTPAAEEYGARLGAPFWAIVAAGVLAAFVGSKFLQRLDTPASSAAPPEEPVPDERAPGLPRRFGQEIKPERAG